MTIEPAFSTFKTYGKGGLFFLYPDFEWSINFADGTSEIQSGDYEVDETDKEIDLENAEGEHQKLDFDLDGDALELSGISDGDRIVLKAERD